MNNGYLQYLASGLSINEFAESMVDKWYLPAPEIIRNITKELHKCRVQSYPSIGDQLDALFHAGVFPPEMAAQIQAVKDKYPKPESINV